MLRKIIIAGGIFFLTQIVNASDTSTNFSTLATVNASCKIYGGNINFGNYDPISTHRTTPLDATGTFNIACTKGVLATLSISSGGNSSQAIGTTRAMTAGGHYLSYELYTSASRSTPWTTLNTVTYTSTSKNNLTTEVIYARIPSGQNTVGGLVYSDIVTVTASY